MTSVFQQHGAFSWCELMTTDRTAAKEFYGRLFGWTMDDQPMAGTIYTVIKAAEQQIGGLMDMPADLHSVPPCWGVYVTVDDVDATVQLAEALGGQIKVPPMNIPDVGRFAILQDPQGAILSIITYRLPEAA